MLTYIVARILHFFLPRYCTKFCLLCSMTLVSDNFLVTASSLGDKIVISNCKGKLVPLFELAEGVSEMDLFLRCFSFVYSLF